MKATSAQEKKILKAIKEQLPQYPGTHSMKTEDIIQNPTKGSNTIFLGAGNGSSEWYDPDQAVLIRKPFNRDRPGRITGYRLKVEL